MSKGFRPAICIFTLALSAVFSRPLRAADGVGPDISKLPAAASAQIDFVRDIQPLLAKQCVDCHGPDKQKGGLRLDLKASVLKGGDDGKVVVLERSAESRLVHLVSGLEEDTIMPPKGERLSVAEIGLLRAWIDQGLVWPEDGSVAKTRSKHWSLQPLQPVAVPAEAKDPIDAFILQRLHKDGLEMSPEADRATLIRRVTFDLIGLPPTPSEIEAFVNDPSPLAYGKLVDRLLASPQYGERWGRHWLDVARYTESTGFEYDRIRDNAWHYRDYVIKSFNEDKPYDRFMREQVAGDVLEPMTTDGVVATSLLVCGPWDQAGNAQSNVTQRMITREDELEDLLAVVGQSFLGLTINCARCHAHKFDPIPHEDYYRLKAVFEGVRHGERPIADPAEIKAQQELKARLESGIAAASTRVAEIEAIGNKLAAAKNPVAPKESGPAAFVRWNFDGSPVTVMEGSVQDGAMIENGRLRLPKAGAHFKTNPLPRDIREKTLEVWVALDNLDQHGGAAISLETLNGTMFDAIVFGEREAKKWMAGSEGFGRTRDLETPPESAPPGTLIHMAAVYKGDNTIALFRNGEPLGKPYKPKVPLQTFTAGNAHIVLGMRHQGGGNPWLTGEIRQAALYDRALSNEEVAASFRAGGYSVPQEEMIASLNDAQRADRESAMAELKRLRTDFDSLKPVAGAVSYVGLREQPAPTRRLIRGDVKSPDETVTPGALSAIVDLNPDFGLPADAPEAARRLKFADWLSDPRNPLPARVMANRVWHLHFGQGLVSSPNDFGASGSRPTHPKLLDWLAEKFIAGGWSVKALHRLILNSANYRQAAAQNEKAAAVDADNLLLWRFTPRRLEAEAVRDSMLAVSGQLNPQMGGPSYRPFTITEFNAAFYHLTDHAEPEFNRRTVYRANVNSGKDPMLDAFDCPEPSVKTPRRGTTTTPLQALELMNNSFVQRQAQFLAERAMKDAGGDLRKGIRAAYQLALGRHPSESEIGLAEKAATDRSLASVCWALLNSTEFVYVK